MKKYIKTTVGCFITLALALPLYWGTSHQSKTEDKQDLDLRIAGRFQQEFDMTKDLATGTVPRNRLLKAYQIAQNKRAEMAMQEDAVPVYWQERGPNNVGGRTRTILFDANDPSNRTIWAGGASGGLWRCNNIDSGSPNWTNINDFFDNLAINAIAQDPNAPNTMYFGTGEEGFNNADAVRGFGIWQSTDGGVNWAQLPSSTSINNVNKIVIANNGDVYAATSGGLLLSTDNGLSWPPVLAGNVQDVEIAPDGDVFATVRSTGVFRDENDGSGFQLLTNNIPTTNIRRSEVVCAPSNANIVYAAFEDNTSTATRGTCQTILQSTDGGDSWTPVSIPGSLGPFCWYAFIMAVDPNDSQRVWIGDQNLFVSDNGGSNWNQIGSIHADHHALVYVPGSSTEMVFGNDGGIYWSSNADAGTPTVSQRNSGFNVTQFYANAAHPTSGSDYILGGTQDNGTQRFNNPGLASTDRPTGNDGAFCFIDQDNPDIQITGSQNRKFFLSTNAGGSFSEITPFYNPALFITPADLDDNADIFYFSEGVDTLGRMTNLGAGNNITYEDISQLGSGRISAIKASPNTANRLFVGTENGNLVRIDNADQNGSITVNTITGAAFPSGYISCVEVQPGDDNHLLVTFSNFGAVSVWETTNGGTSWQNIEGDLPDMPVRWAIFHPFDYDQVLLATELGVWSTDDLDGTSTSWWPTNNFGLANVRVDMLEYRPSDHLVVAATHGRGMYSTDYFTLVNACIPNLVLGGSITPGVYVADDFIVSDGTLNVGEKAIFQAAGFIDLTDGFLAPRGSDFWALIKECGGSPAPANAMKPDSDPHQLLDRNGSEDSGFATQLNIQAFPNPASYMLNIQYDVPQEGVCNMYLRDLNGRMVQHLLSSKNHASGSFQIQADLSDLQAGVYLLTLQSAQGAITQRILIARQ
ncbi:MAG: T9SS type A sorting domain-containing protein [Saprospiraceae bacterium]